MLNKVGFVEAIKKLKDTGHEFETVFHHGSLSVELYKPDKIDQQQPHERDEVYLIASGKGEFVLENEVSAIQSGDFLFVPAGAHHRFIKFSEDFSTWVLFYGPLGGEGEKI